MTCSSLLEIAQLPALISVRQAAKIVAVSEGTILNLIERGAISAVKVGRSWRINTREFISFLSLEEDVEDVKEMLGVKVQEPVPTPAPVCVAEVREDNGRRVISFRRAASPREEMIG